MNLTRQRITLAIGCLTIVMGASSDAFVAHQVVEDEPAMPDPAAFNPQPPAVPEAHPADEEPEARPANSAENNPLAGEMTPELHEAVQKGFDYLRTQQNSDGSFGRGRYGKHVGITALCALAYMADGNLPGRGPYGQEVARALEFVLANSPETGLLAGEA